MRHSEKIILRIGAVLILLILLVTGCSFENETNSRSDVAVFSDSSGKKFEAYYTGEVYKDLKQGDKRALIKLFAKEVRDGAGDLSEGADYLMGFFDKKDAGIEMTGTRSSLVAGMNVKNEKADAEYDKYSYNSVTCIMELETDGQRFRIIMSGWGDCRYRVKGHMEHDYDKIGLYSMIIHELGSDGHNKGDEINTPYLNGISYPGRAPYESMISDFLFVYPRFKGEDQRDLCFDAEGLRQAEEVYIDMDLLDNADGKEKAGLDFFLNEGSKKCGGCFYEKTGDGVILDLTFTYRYKAHKIKILAEDGVLKGAVIGTANDDLREVTPEKGKLQGFDDFYDEYAPY